MSAATIRRRVKSREVTDEAGNLKYYVLTTHRNHDLEVTVDPNRTDPVDITKRPGRLTEEQARCLVAILQHGLRLLGPMSLRFPLQSGTGQF